MRFEKVRGGRGWFNESERHALAAKGEHSILTESGKTLRYVIGQDLIKKLEQTHSLYSPEYEEFWKKEITPLVKERIILMSDKIDNLQRDVRQLEYLKYPLAEYRLKELFKKMNMLYEKVE